MSLHQDFPELGAHIATAMEQLGSLSESTLQGIELGARHIANTLQNGGRLLVQPSTGTQFLAQSLCDDLLWRHRNQQPALPAQLLQQGLDDPGLAISEVEVLGREGDTLLLLADQMPGLPVASLQQLYQNRGIDSLYLGPDAAQLEAGCVLAIEVSAGSLQRQLESTLFILHCLSDRIQSLVFRGG